MNAGVRRRGTRCIMIPGDVREAGAEGVAGILDGAWAVSVAETRPIWGFAPIINRIQLHCQCRSDRRHDSEPSTAPHVSSIWYSRSLRRPMQARYGTASQMDSLRNRWFRTRSLCLGGKGCTRLRPKLHPGLPVLGHAFSSHSVVSWHRAIGCRIARHLEGCAVSHRS